VVIDPGDEPERILEQVRSMDLEISEILGTHGHVDHAGAVAPLKRLLGVPFAIHPSEQPLLERLPHQAAVFGLPDRETPTIDRELAHGDTVQVGSIEGRVILTPGHSPGGCCFYFAQQKVIFVGDTLFAGSIGRTDLPGGSMSTLLSAIREHLFDLDDDVVVHCGHGPSTTIGVERRSNPFLQPGSPLIF
jgi:glyoxylase-like metal-dependent hydrolase (beta-lactamase superfamily II)